MVFQITEVEKSLSIIRHFDDSLQSPTIEAAFDKATTQHMISKLVITQVTFTESEFLSFLSCVTQCPLRYLDLTGSTFSTEQSQILNKNIIQHASLETVNGFNLTTLSKRQLQANQVLNKLYDLLNTYKATPVESALLLAGRKQFIDRVIEELYLPQGTKDIQRRFLGTCIKNRLEDSLKQKFY